MSEPNKKECKTYEDKYGFTVHECGENCKHKSPKSSLKQEPNKKERFLVTKIKDKPANIRTYTKNGGAVNFSQQELVDSCNCKKSDCVDCYPQQEPTSEEWYKKLRPEIVCGILQFFDDNVKSDYPKVYLLEDIINKVSAEIIIAQRQQAKQQIKEEIIKWAEKERETNVPIEHRSLLFKGYKAAMENLIDYLKIL
jgi:hypothetical protein